MALERLLERETLHKSTLTCCRPVSETRSNFDLFHKNTLVVPPTVDLSKPRLQLSKTGLVLSFRILSSWLKMFDKDYTAGFTLRAGRGDQTPSKISL